MYVAIYFRHCQVYDAQNCNATKAYVFNTNNCETFHMTLYTYMSVTYFLGVREKRNKNIKSISDVAREEMVLIEKENLQERRLIRIALEKLAAAQEKIAQAQLRVAEVEEKKFAMFERDC